jgi:hypothetical protein
MSNPFDQPSHGSTPPPPPPPAWGQAPPPPPGYAPYGGGGFGPQQHPKGTTILVLGIVGLLCCGPLGIVAIVMGSTARKEMAANPGVTYTNAGLITAGWILGIVATVLWAIFLVIRVAAL